MHPHEGLGEKFNLDDYLKSQQKTRKLVQDFSQFMVPGIRESEAKSLLEEFMDASGIETRWHPTKLRMGPNTVKNFRDNSEEAILQTSDIYFVDIGPVYFGHEGDYGETFVMGEDNGRDEKIKRLKDLQRATRSIFESTKSEWRDRKLTGAELYNFAAREAKNLNLKLNSNMYGHRLGDFPHAIHSREKLGNLDYSPAENLWILEIHLIDENINRGAFFEDLL